LKATQYHTLKEEQQKKFFNYLQLYDQTSRHISADYLQHFFSFGYRGSRMNNGGALLELEIVPQPPYPMTKM